MELGDWVIMGGYAGIAPVHQGRRARLHRQQCRGDARRAAVHHGSGNAGRAALDQLRRAQASRLHARADPQSQECVPGVVPLGPQAERCGRGAHQARLDSARTQAHGRLHRRFHAQSRATEVREVAVAHRISGGRSIGRYAGRCADRSAASAFPRRAVRRSRGPQDEGRGLHGVVRQRGARGHGPHRNPASPAAPPAAAHNPLSNGSSPGAPTSSSASIRPNSISASRASSSMRGSRPCST